MPVWTKDKVGALMASQRQQTIRGNSGKIHGTRLPAMLSSSYKEDTLRFSSRIRPFHLNLLGRKGSSGLSFLINRLKVTIPKAEPWSLRCIHFTALWRILAASIPALALWGHDLVKQE